MTLNEYIEGLTLLRDNYNAGDFTVMVDEACHGFTEHGQHTVHTELVPMDGDDYCLDLGKKICEIHAKIIK